jgi:hypothetical protein
MFSYLFGRSPSKKAVDDRARAVPPKFEGLEDRTVPATFLVTTTADGGDGSLRDAVGKANVSAGADVIQFQVPSSNSGVLTLTEGEIAVTDDVSIVGQGMDKTIISGNRQSRIFNVEGAAKVDLALQDMTLYQGTAQGDGGAVRVAGATLHAARVNFLENQADHGGGVAVIDRGGLSGEAVFDGAIFNRNTAGTAGGGLYVNSTQPPSNGPHVLLKGTNLASNMANSPLGGGGGVAVEAGVLNAEGNSFVANTSLGGGGGIDTGVSSTVNVMASTFHQNASTSGLGGAGILARGDLVISNSTITGNSDTSGTGVGGVNHLGSSGLLLSSTIVSGNTGLDAKNNPDLKTSAAAVSDGHNLVGKSNGVQGLLATDLVGVDPQLGPLQYNGGTTASRVPLAGSAAIGAGNNPYNASYDQRGAGFSRRTQGAIDIGAVQFDAANPAPVAVIAAAPSVSLDSSMTSYQFAVTFTDDTKINLQSIDNADVVVTGPNGFSQKATLVQTDLTTHGSPLSALYQIVPPGGKWTPLANGVYTIALQANQVFDERGRPVAGQSLGTFAVNVQGDQIGYVEALYRSVLGRASDADSLKAYTERLTSGESRESIAKEIWNSREHREAQVTNYYQTLLKRAPDVEGLEYWTDRLMSGASEEEVTAGILGSKELVVDATAGVVVTNNFYRAIFGRTADADAIDYTTKLDAGTASPEQVVKELATSEERVVIDVQGLYQRILLRAPDEFGASEWVKKAKRDGGIGNVAVDMLASDEFFKLHGSTV